jgi:glycerophosphoryl diester phosphodiesterase
MHDPTVARTTSGKGKVADMTFAEIRSLDAGSWKAPEYTGQIVPLIDEVLDLLDASGQTAVIDIKDPAVIDKVVGLAQKKAMTDRITVLSDDRKILDRVASLDRNIKRAWLCSDFPITAITPAKQARWLTDTAIKYDVQIVNVNYMLLSPRIIKHLHKRNIKVWTWTVNHPEIIKHLLDWGVDAITTDKPAMIKAIRDTKTKSPLQLPKHSQLRSQTP